MTLSAIAIVISGVSLAWNVISTIRGWRKSAIKIKINARSHLERDPNTGSFAMWLRLTAFNVGGAAVGVTAIGVILEFDREKNTKGAWEISSGYANPQTPMGIVGPQLPATIDPHHSHSWNLDIAHVVGSLLERKEPPIELQLYLELSNGSTIEQPITLGEWTVQEARKIRRDRHEKTKDDGLREVTRIEGDN